MSYLPQEWSWGLQRLPSSKYYNILKLAIFEAPAAPLRGEILDILCVFGSVES